MRPMCAFVQILGNCPRSRNSPRQYAWIEVTASSIAWWYAACAAPVALGALSAAWAGSTSTAITQTVTQANTSTTVSSSANPSLIGNPVTFTATVANLIPGYGTPTGSVLFSIDGTAQTPAVALAWEAGGKRATPREALADYLAATIDRVARRARPQAGDLPRLPATVGAWIGALSREDPVVHLQGDGARSLRRQVNSWTDLSLTSDQVWLMMEDVWVQRSMLDAVRSVNAQMADFNRVKFQKADGSVIVRFRASGMRELAWHLFTWGDKLQILAPPGLREILVREIEVARNAHTSDSVAATT